MAAATLRGMVESGALQPGRDGWIVDESGWAAVQSSATAADVLTRRLELLDEPQLRFLTYAAVLGKEFSVALASALAGFDDSTAERIVAETQDRHFIWTLDSSDRCAFVHDKIRQALLDRPSAAERRAMHLAAADYLRAHESERLTDLAYHYDAAGRPELAALPALHAARQARARFSLQVAQQLYEIADRGRQVLAVDDVLDVVQGLGEIQILRGRYDEAQQLLERAATLAVTEVDRANVSGKLGELAFKRGDMEIATQELERALGFLGRRVPRKLLILPAFLLQVMIQSLHTWLPRWFLGRKKRMPDRSERLALHLYSRLAHSCWFARSKAMCLWAHFRNMNLAECYLPTAELGQAYSEHGPGMSLVPLPARGERYVRKSLEIRKSLGDAWGQGQSLHYLGVVQYGSGQFEACIESCREATRLLERTGDYWEVHIARLPTGGLALSAGAFRRGGGGGEDHPPFGASLGDYQASGMSLDIWSLATLGSLREEITHREMARTRYDGQGIAQLLIGEGVRRIRLGQYAAAVDVLRQALRAARKTGIRNAYVLPALSWLATALRRRAETEACYDPPRRRKLLREARRWSRIASFHAWLFPNDRPHAARELALSEALLGRRRAARRALARSAAAAQRLGSQHEWLQTRWVAAHMLGAGDTASDAIDLGPWQQLYAVDPPAATPRGESASVSLIDRFERVLDHGRRIAAALSEDVIVEEVTLAATALLRGQHATLVRVEQDENGRVRVLGRPVLPPRDLQLIEAAARRGQAIAESVDRDEESRSALCRRSSFADSSPRACSCATTSWGNCSARGNCIWRTSSPRWPARRWRIRRGSTSCGC